MDDEQNAPRFEDLAVGEFAQHFIKNAVKWMATAKLDFALAETEEARCDAAERLFKWSLRATALAVGPDALKLVYGTPVADDRRLALLRAWYRVGLMEPLFDRLDSPDDLASIASLQSEFLALANDDAPRLFDRVEGGASGVRRNTYRLAPLKLRALGWEAFLRSRDMKAGQAQSMVSIGFGKSWEAIRGWKATTIEALGAENVEQFLARAAQGQEFHYLNAVDAGDLAAAIRADGLALAEEEKRNAEDAKGLL